MLHPQLGHNIQMLHIKELTQIAIQLLHLVPLVEDPAHLRGHKRRLPRQESLLGIVHEHD